jgi:hypothetical protein
VSEAERAIEATKAACTKACPPVVVNGRELRPCDWPELRPCDWLELRERVARIKKEKTK